MTHIAPTFRTICICLFLLIFCRNAHGQDILGSTNTASNTDTTITTQSDDSYIQDSGAWAGGGLGVHFDVPGAPYQKMLVMLTSEYRYQAITSFLLELHWWNTDQGEKKYVCLGAGLKLRAYVLGVNFFALGELGLATSTFINLPFAFGVELPTLGKWRPSIQIRGGLSDVDSSPYFITVNLMKGR